MSNYMQVFYMCTITHPYPNIYARLVSLNYPEGTHWLKFSSESFVAFSLPGCDLKKNFSDQTKSSKIADKISRNRALFRVLIDSSAKWHYQLPAIYDMVLREPEQN